MISIILDDNKNLFALSDVTGTSTSEDVSEIDMAKDMSGAMDHIRVSLHMMLGN